eukprot:1966083-Rhodomonas_salina.1
MIVPWDLYALKRLTNEITGVDGAVVWSRERDTRNMCAVSSAGLQTPERKPGREFLSTSPWASLS